MNERDRKLIADFMGRIITIMSCNLPGQDEQLRINLYELVDIRTEFITTNPPEGGEG